MFQHNKSELAPKNQGKGV